MKLPVRRNEAGFTMMEVLVAAAVMGIGLVGILAMQSTAGIANRRAYDMRVAMELAETTLERVKRDAIAWTGSTATLDNKGWLGTGMDDTNVNGWTAPPSADASVKPTLNDMGIANEDSEALPSDMTAFREKSSRFCVQYRFNWVVPQRLARADVRVFWPNNRAGERAMGGNCNVFTNGSIQEADYDQYFEWVRVSGMVRQNVLGASTTVSVGG